ncbi:MAG TPA: PAS and helix-turn-helix domain-containing protein [Thermoleophilaceae bacterium]|nr:PAS and helix-turn-helix domain-containing protein [Thermoleophilaceae bacterium]
MASPPGWAGLFWTAFKRSRNGMALLDEQRRLVDVNPAFVSLLLTRRAALIDHAVWERVVGGPLMTQGQWRVALGRDEFSGTAELARDDGATITVQFAGHPETVTGRRYVLAVVLGHTHSRRHSRRRRSNGQLTDREREVVRLLGEGQTGPEIAADLHIAHNTVRTHVYNAMTKLGAHSRAHLVAKALGEAHLH